MHASVSSEKQRDRETKKQRNREREKEKEQGRERERKGGEEQTVWLAVWRPPCGRLRILRKIKKNLENFAEANAATPQKSGTIPLGRAGGAWGPRLGIIYGHVHLYCGSLIETPGTTEQFHNLEAPRYSAN